MPRAADEGLGKEAASAVTRVEVELAGCGDCHEVALSVAVEVARRQDVAELVPRRSDLRSVAGLESTRAIPRVHEEAARGRDRDQVSEAVPGEIPRREDACELAPPTADDRSTPGEEAAGAVAPVEVQIVAGDSHQVGQPVAIPVAWRETRSVRAAPASIAGMWI